MKCSKCKKEMKELKRIHHKQRKWVCTDCEIVKFQKPRRIRKKIKEDWK